MALIANLQCVTIILTKQQLRALINSMQRRSFVKYLILSGLLPAKSVFSMSNANQLEEELLKITQSSSSEGYLRKIRNPNNIHEGDITTSFREQLLINQLAYRLGQVKQVVGHGNFSVLSFDDMLRYGNNYSKIGTFDKAETNFLEKLFYEDAMHYGFYGEKPLTNITQCIEDRSIAKVPSSGQFLFKGKPLELYKKIKRDVGDNLILTSGVRSVVKQMHLFLNKASKYEGNLSLASRSLAPPGYSFHGIGDFDVGQAGLGARNFTDDFAKTDEFKKLIDLGYTSIRYPKDNQLGVRFEPWHIKVS